MKAAQTAKDKKLAGPDPLEQAKGKAKEALDQVKKAADDLSNQKVGAKIGSESSQRSSNDVGSGATRHPGSSRSHP